MVMVHTWYTRLLGHSGEIAGKRYVRPLFLQFGFLFWLVGTLWSGSGVRYSGKFGLGGLGIQVQELTG